MAGLDRPTCGEVRVDDSSIGQMNDRQLTKLRRARLGFIFQALNLVATLTVEENILLPLNIARAEVDREGSTRSSRPLSARVA
jgi:putative ABC transport system ATP-binding protein